MAADPSGRFVVVWTSGEQDGEDRGVFGQRFDADGAPLGDEFQVNVTATYSQKDPTVATDSAGDFVVAWSSVQDCCYFGYNMTIARRFDTDGKPLGGEFEVNQTGTGYDPAAAADAEGRFVVVWNSYYADGGFADDIVGRRYEAGGDAAGPEFLANEQLLSWQSVPSVAADRAGNFVVVWESDPYETQAFGRVYDNTGKPVSGDFPVSATGVQVAPVVAVSPAGQLVVVWCGADGSGGGILGRRFLLPPIFADGFESGGTAAWDQTVQ